VLNRNMAKAGAVPVPVAGATEAATATPPQVAGTLRQLKLVQWLNPAAGLALIALSDWQSQQQRASEAAKGRTRRLLPGSVPAVPAGAVAGAVALGVLASRRRKPAGPPSPVELGVVAVDEVEIDIVQVDLIDPSVTPPPTPPIGGPGTPPPSRRLDHRTRRAAPRRVRAPVSPVASSVQRQPGRPSCGARGVPAGAPVGR